MTTAQVSKTYGTRNRGTGIPSRALSPSLIQYAEVDISSAAVLTLNASPVTIVPAPGGGRVLEFISAVLIIDYNSTTYATNGVCNFRYTDGSGTIVSDSVAAAAFLHQVDDCIEVCQALSAEVELTANAALVFSVDTGEVDTGNSPIRIKCAFRVHETGL